MLLFVTVLHIGINLLASQSFLCAISDVELLTLDATVAGKIGWNWVSLLNSIAAPLLEGGKVRGGARLRVCWEGGMGEGDGDMGLRAGRAILGSSGSEGVLIRTPSSVLDLVFELKKEEDISLSSITRGSFLVPLGMEDIFFISIGLMRIS